MQIMNIQLQLLLHQKDTLELLKVRNLCSIALSSNLFWISYILNFEKGYSGLRFFPVEITVVDVKLTPCDPHFQKYNFRLLKSFKYPPELHLKKKKRPFGL